MPNLSQDVAPIPPSGLQVHPAAAIFPMMDDASFQALKADIEAHGLEESVVLYRGQLLDGRNRARACEELDVQFLSAATELDDEQDPVAFVLSANLHRRQLRTSQKAVCAARVANLPVGKPSSNSLNCGSYSAEQAAAMFGVSVASIERARKVLAEGCAELIALCESGKSVAAACKFIDTCKTKKEQAQVARDGWSAIKGRLPGDREKCHEPVAVAEPAPPESPCADGTSDLWKAVGMLNGITATVLERWPHQWTTEQVAALFFWMDDVKAEAERFFTGVDVVVEPVDVAKQLLSIHKQLRSVRKELLATETTDAMAKARRGDRARKLSKAAGLVDRVRGELREEKTADNGEPAR